jgi:hypothetical protein
MPQPYTVHECLELANSLIDKSVTQVQLVQWKQKMLVCNFTEENVGRVGLKWWRNFVKRYTVHLSIGKAIRFDMRRNEWCKLETFQKMYDFIYDKLSEKGLAEVWETENMLDKEGNEVTNKEDMHGRPTKYNLTHPEKLIFVDEVGYNISQANDGNKTGTKYVTGKGFRAQQQNSLTECHYTTLGFTAATGEPLMCAIIISADRLKDHEKLGFNCCSPNWKDGIENWDDDQIGGLLTEENIRGFDKIFPCGPTCEFEGKTVPCFVAWTLKGSIMTALLAEMLKKMDDMELFDRSDGIDPFLLLDGHGSRFELPFVEYIHGDREWTVCIGVHTAQACGKWGTVNNKTVSTRINQKKARRKYLP